MSLAKGWGHGGDINMIDVIYIINRWRCLVEKFREKVPIGVGEVRIKEYNS